MRFILGFAILFSVFYPVCTGAADLFLLQDKTLKTGVPYAGGRSSGQCVYLPKKYTPKKDEFRGIWVATVENIDFPVYSKASDYRKAYIELVDRVASAGFTAILFQVRPMCDAYYISELNPLSRCLTGREGAFFMDEPQFDPLAFMVRETHRRKLEFHAWLNPYRVVNRTPLTKNAYLASLAATNYARKNARLVLEYPVDKMQRGLILNPGEPEVMNYLIRTVNEIINQYDVDGIHMDDYFYPYVSIGNSDLATWKKYAKDGISIEDWRRENINMLIRNMHGLVVNHNKVSKRRIRFGISPFGIWANSPVTEKTVKPPAKNAKPIPSMAAGSLTSGSQSYFTQFADTRKWVREEWIDYIVPQLYWGFPHQKAAYAALADWWADTVKGTKVDLYIGHAVYKQGAASDFRDPDELTNQILFNCLRPEIKGSILFSYCRVFQPENDSMKKAVRKLIEKYWEMNYIPEKKKDKKK